MLSFWILINRDDLDQEKPPVPDAEPEGFAHGRLSPRQHKNTDSKPNANPEDAGDA